jgi:hypothetical protein
MAVSLLGFNGALIFAAADIAAGAAGHRLMPGVEVLQLVQSNPDMLYMVQRGSQWLGPGAEFMGPG